jgi:hypothetical protein
MTWDRMHELQYIDNDAYFKPYHYMRHLSIFPA